MARPASAAPAILALLGWLAAAPAAAQNPERITVETSSGAHEFTVEWAVTPAERARGLMFRESLPLDHGMVFDFGREQPVSFWMKNTPLPLDMIFINEDGSVASIAENTTPFSEAPVPAGEPVRYVLEVLAGTAQRISLDPGDRVRLTP